MIAWGILWVILLFTTLLFVAMEIVNGSIEIRFWLCFFFIFALILIPIFTIGAYTQSKDFAYQYENFQSKVAEMTESQEYTYFGNALNYNTQLQKYKQNIHRFGIFAPYYRKIKYLEPIQFKSYDMTKYTW